MKKRKIGRLQGPAGHFALNSAGFQKI